MMKKNWICLLLALLLALLCAGALAEMDYEDGNPPLAPDIMLPENPSTGYLWTAVTDDPCVEIMDNGFYDDGTGLAGAGGTHSFRLFGAEAGYAEITLTYGRAWEDQPLYTLIYRVIVEESGDVMIYEMQMSQP